MSLFSIFESLHEKLVGTTRRRHDNFYFFTKLYALPFEFGLKRSDFHAVLGLQFGSSERKRCMTFYTLHYLQIFRITQLHQPWNMRLKQEETSYLSLFPINILISQLESSFNSSCYCASLTKRAVLKSSATISILDCERSLFCPRTQRRTQH